MKGAKLPPEIVGVIERARRDGRLERDRLLPACPTTESPHPFIRILATSPLRCFACSSDMRARPIHVEHLTVPCHCSSVTTLGVMCSRGARTHSIALEWPEFFALYGFASRLERIAREADQHGLDELASALFSAACGVGIRPGTQHDVRHLVREILREALRNLAVYREECRDWTTGESNARDRGQRRWILTRLYLETAFAARAARRALDRYGVPPAQARHVLTPTQVLELRPRGVPR